MKIFAETFELRCFGKLETISGSYGHLCENVDDVEVNY